jgi:hypothetical protein
MEELGDLDMQQYSNPGFQYGEWQDFATSTQAQAMASNGC